MRALECKRWRDFRRLRGQVAAIALVVGAGVAIFIMSMSTFSSLTRTRETYYRDYLFADLFLHLKRAPLSLLEQLRAIPGIERLRPRVVASAGLQVQGFAEPISGRLIGLPSPGADVLHKLYLRRGRPAETDRDDEAVVCEAFARAHGLKLGDLIGATVNGRYRSLRVVGIALSPEFIYQLDPGSLFPDYRRFGILWLGHQALAGAFDMEGAFNDLLVGLAPEARPAEVMARLDRLFLPYGGLGAYGREEQLSNRYLMEEMRQLKQMATIYPLVFLAVAAFLLQVAMARLIAAEREEIGIL
ncbi:MAG: ABC transporter permease, partial [Deltaproteobacteria bacterium]|nr:ABC transporter permease [Deltaproteobacteria bacterium]